MASKPLTNAIAPTLLRLNNPISKAIGFANYLSNWVATMIMVQSTSDARARVMEHMIRLAVRLRELDNFDSLSQQNSIGKPSGG